MTRIEWASNEGALAFTVVASPCNATGIYPKSFIVVDLEEGIARTVISDDPILAWQFEWLGDDALLVHGQGMQRRIDVNTGAVVSEERMPALSPDEGQDLGWLTFIADPGGYPAVFAVRADGSGLEQLSEDISGLFADIDHPRIEDWSPDGAWIAFTGLPRNANDVDVFIARVDRLERTNLTDSRATDSDPDWSPDGEQIAYSSQLPGWNSQPDIYIMPVHPGEPIQPSRLTETLTFDSAPAWSPDGFTNCFCQYKDGSKRQRSLSHRRRWFRPPKVDG